MLSDEFKCEPKCKGPGHQIDLTTKTCSCDASYRTVLDIDDRTCVHCPRNTVFVEDHCRQCDGVGLVWSRVNGCSCDTKHFGTVWDDKTFSCHSCNATQLVSIDSCIDCFGPGAELLEHGDRHVCACDVKKENTVLRGSECQMCPDKHVAVRIIETNELPIYSCTPCHGPTAVIQDTKCTCSAPYVLHNGRCSLCTPNELYFESQNGIGACVACDGFLSNDGECVACTGPSAHRIGVDCRCHPPYVLREGSCHLCPVGKLYCDDNGIGACIPCTGDGAVINHGECECDGNDKWLIGSVCNKCDDGHQYSDAIVSRLDLVANNASII